MPNGAADNQAADDQAADNQAADRAGNNASPSVPTVPSTPSATGATLMYCTLPLQLSENQQGAEALTRLDWKQHMTAPQLRLTLQDANGLPFVLGEGDTVTLRLSKLLGNALIIETSMTVEYGLGGIVAYTFDAGDVAIAGTFALEVEVEKAGSVFYFPTWGNVLFVLNKALGGP